MNHQTFKQVLNDPRFREIIKKKLLLGLVLSVAMTSIYAAFVLIMVFRPDWMLPPISVSNPFNIGMLSSLLLLMLIMISMVCYFFFKGNDTHSDIHKLIDEYKSRDKNQIN